MMQKGENKNMSAYFDISKAINYKFNRIAEGVRLLNRLGSGNLVNSECTSVCF